MLRTMTLALPLLGAVPQAAPAATPSAGVAPLTVTFSSIPPDGILYEWDFDFIEDNGFLPDFADVLASDVSYTYSAAGLYTARLVVTDDEGAQTFHDVAVAVFPASGPPALELTLSVSIKAGASVSASAEAVARIDAAVASYEWDVENDGTVDQSGAALSSISFTPPSAGNFTLRLVVTDDEGQAAVLLRPYKVLPKVVLLAPPPPPPDPPVIGAFFVTTGGATTDLAPGKAAGFNARVGDLVTFNATAGAGLDLMRNFRFDFDGRNGVVEFDRTVPATPMSEADPTSSVASATHHYDTPGTYTVTLRVQDTEDFIATRTATVNVSVEPGAFKTWLFRPRNGQHVFGDAVTIRAKTFPTGQTASVTFKYRAVSGDPPPPPSDPSWTTIQTVVPPPFTFLSTSWDVTGLPPGDYDLAAVATRTTGGSAESLSNERIVVTVDSATPEILETVASHFSQGIDPNRNESSGLAGDVIVDIPSGATDSYDQMRIARRGSNPHPLEARLQGLTFLSKHFRRINFDGGLDELALPSRVTFYIDDEDGDGVVDGEAIKKSSLKVYRFNPLLKAWQPLGEQIVQPQEDLVRASFLAVGDVGIAGDADGRAPAETSSDCGLLGLEAFLILALLRRRRP